MRAQGSGVPLMGRRNPRHAGPGAGGAKAPVAELPGRCGGEGEEADPRAPAGREREEGRAGERWLGLVGEKKRAGLAHAGERKRRRGVLGLGLGKEREGEGEGFGPAGWAPFSSFSFSTLH
jgi:hypothetical protein